MGGLTNVFLLWFPVLIYRGVSAFFRTIWKFNLWTLQTICGIPLYYCKPEYRIPGIFIGTIGLMCVSSLMFFLLTMMCAPETGMLKRGSQLNEMLIVGVVGVGMLILCKVMIRKGSI